MDKIPFVDGKKIKNATVTVNEQEYEVTPAQYTGTTPMSAFNLNKMQDNIEKAIPITNTIKVSATEPKNNADVWVKHGKNLYKGQSLQNGLYAGASNTIGGNSNGWYVIVPITGGATYTISKKYTNADNSNLQLFLCTTQDFPAKGVSMIDIWRGSVSLANTTIETSENANYLFICLAAGSKSIITEEIQKMAVEELMVEVGAEKKDYEAPLEDDILVNDNGVYKSVLTKEIKTGIEIKTNKKVDGKDIYYKKINLGIGPNATSKAYSIGINFSNIVDANVFVKGSANCFKLPFLAQDAQEFINYYFQSNQIIIQAGKDRSKYNFYLDIYYTK